jgi:hypothetical protein
MTDDNEPAAFPIRPFGVVPAHPLPTAIDVQPAAVPNMVQMAVSTAAGVTVVWLPNDFARDIAGKLFQASTGIVLANNSHIPKAG